MHAIRLLLIAASILVSGCATNADRWNAIDQDAATLPELAALAIEPVPLEYEKPRDVLVSGPIHAFADGKRRVAGVSLPSLTVPTYLAFETGDDEERRWQVIAPRFTFLDRDKAAIRTVTPRWLLPNAAAWKHTFQGRVRVPPQARYVIVSAMRPSEIPTTGQYSLIRQPIPEGRIRLRVTTEPAAVVVDSVERDSGGKGRFFMVTKIDGDRTPTARGLSHQASQGAGMALTLLTLAREVPARPVRLTLEASHATAAPIHALFSYVAGTYQNVEGTVPFEPEPDREYEVRGELRPQGSSVWIVDLQTQRIVARVDGRR